MSPFKIFNSLLVAAAATTAAVLINVSVASTDSSTSNDKTQLLAPPSAYLLLPDVFDVLDRPAMESLYKFLRQLNVKKSATAESILNQLKAANDDPEIDKKLVGYFLDLAADNEHMDCDRIKLGRLTIMRTFGLSTGKLGKSLIGDYESYLRKYGAQAYGICARKINREFTDSVGPAIDGERALDKIIAAAVNELESKQVSADHLDDEQLFKRARLVDLKGEAINVKNMLEAANELRGITQVPTEAGQAAKNLMNFLLHHCEELGNAYWLELGVLSMAYALDGDNLQSFTPRLLKLHEYRRICMTRQKHGGEKKIEKNFKKLFRRKRF